MPAISTIRCVLLIAWALGLTLATCAAQGQLPAGKIGQNPPTGIKVPPVPVLSPLEEMKTLRSSRATGWNS
jgi:hypothetical protein